METETRRDAKIYIRRNGSFGASCNGTLDTGHHIVEDSGQFTVFSIHDGERVIADKVSRYDAEAAITSDWEAM